VKHAAVNVDPQQSAVMCADWTAARHRWLLPAGTLASPRSGIRRRTTCTALTPRTTTAIRRPSTTGHKLRASTCAVSHAPHRPACLTDLTLCRALQPCLKPDVFNPTDLDAEDWMAASAAMGMREIIITVSRDASPSVHVYILQHFPHCSNFRDCGGQAHHEGGFALWPSKHTPYSVAASSWKGGKGDVLREFADAANKWGIRIGYYLNVQDDGYMNLVANYTCDDFIKRQIGMVTEVLTEYGKLPSSSSPVPTAYSLYGFSDQGQMFWWCRPGQSLLV
jgi:hypothetical protein